MRGVEGKRNRTPPAKKEDLEIKGVMVTGREDRLLHQSDSPATPALPRTQPATADSGPTPPLLFSYPFSSCHSKRYSQLVKVHYTLSSWPEIYTPQRLHCAREGCNPLRLMTVHVSRQEPWIFWLCSMWINMTESYYGEVTFKAVILKSHVFAGKKKRRRRKVYFWRSSPSPPQGSADHKTLWNH